MKLERLIKIYNDVNNGNIIIDGCLVDKIAEEASELFVKLCGCGRKDIIIWMDNLLTENRPYIDLYKTCQKAFRESCINGYIDIAEWLFNLDKCINIHINNEQIFRFVCANGYLDVAMWLYYISLESTEIKIGIRDNYAFRYACMNKHKHVAEWLYNLSLNSVNNKINIRARNDVAFKTSCDNNNRELVGWLCSLCPHYVITFEHNNKYKPITLQGKNNMKTTFKIHDMKSTLKQIYEKNDKDKLNMLYLNVSPKKIDDFNMCPICMADDETKFVQFECDHLVCAMCFSLMDKCYYRCKGSINSKKIKLISIDLTA
jgi:hypothetical protein